jgi:cell division protein FtsB
LTTAKKTKKNRTAPVRGGDERRRTARNNQRRAGDAPPRRRPTREHGPLRSAPQTNPIPRPTDAPHRAKNASQAKARAKARKAKAPKVVRPPLRERILVRLASIDLNPRTLVARVPFVVLVIGSLGVGLGATLWLSTDAAERSYQLGAARETNQALQQQKEALERDVLEAQAAPALAEAARGLGMIPSRDTAHLVQDPAGNWIVVGTPKPAEGVPPPPLNTPLPDEAPAPPPGPPAPRVVEPREVPVRIPGRTAPTPAGPGTALAAPPGAEVPHILAGQVPALGPAPAAPLVAPPAEVPAPLDAGTPHAVVPAPLPGPVPGAPA